MSRTHIVFVEAGQLWIVPRAGGAATRITDTAGNKSAPRFSPDGATLAFTNRDVYTVPVRGGTPSRLTYLPGQQTLCQWTAGGRILFYSGALSFSSIEQQLYAVAPADGLPVRLPLAYGSDGAIDATGTWLAYTPRWPTQLISRWARYRGGAAPDLWLLNLKSGQSRKITDWPGSDLNPMWDGATLYYVSDDGAEERRNVWAYEPATNARRQVTHFRDYDVRNASIGAGAIVFELGPAIELLDLRSGKAAPVRLTTPPASLEREVDASRFTTNTQRAGGTVLMEARGDVWVSRASAPPRNLTRTSGAFEREAALRPDGRAVAYWSDATGEYQLYIRDLDVDAAPQPLTNYASGFRFRPLWSPDGQRLAFIDHAGAIVVFDIAARRATEVDVERRTIPYGMPDLAWSPDSTWLAYTKSSPNRVGALWRYEIATGARQQLTAPAFEAGGPVFDTAGEHLFFVSARNFDNTVYDWMEQRITARAFTTLMDVPLRGLTFDAAAVERRATRLPVASGSIVRLSVTPEGNPLYALVDLGGKSSVRTYDLKTRRETVVSEGTTDLEASAPKVDTAAMKVRIDLRAEWRELFDDAWRDYRDLFFAPIAAAVDWPRVKARYEPMLAACRSREEVNLVLAEMIGQSGVGHAYLGGRGDVAPPVPDDMATLGTDVVLDRGAFRIAHVVEGAPWDDTVRSPLHDAQEGEYLLAVNGTPFDVTRDYRASLLGLAGKEVQITVGPTPNIDAQSRTLTVTPLANESELRRRAWIESNRRRVDEASGGCIGYVHIPAFTVAGFSDLVRQFYGQIAKEALIVDARWSQGGFTGAILAELLARKPLNYAAQRYGEAWPAPPFGAHFGRKALLVNHITVSAGENFSFYFRKLALGPIVGARTWGGLTGLNSVPPLIDGGVVNVPSAPFFDAGGWLIEGKGLEPAVGPPRLAR